MEKLSTHRRNVAAFAGLGLIATPLVALGNPAFAATADCTAVDPSATEVLPDICEIQYPETGEYTFTAPAGVTKLSAVIVGAGGARSTAEFGNYAGGGGAVVYVSQVDVSAPIDVVVGMGAQTSDAAGTASSVNDDVAAAGFTGTADPSPGGGASGNGNAGGLIYAEGGGGGAGAAGSGSNGGIGLQASAVANDTAMWPAVDGEPYYGSGGDVQPMVAGYGEAGWGADGSGQRDFGMDGLVILRWTFAGLANTGLTTWNIALGAMFAAGLFFVAFGSLSARNTLRFAGSRERLVGLLKDANDRLSREDSSRRDDVS